MKWFSFVLLAAMFATASLADNKTSLADFFNDDAQTRKIEKENFERRMRQVREDAAVEAERDRLSRERLDRISEQNKPKLYDLNKVMKWSEVLATPEFKALSKEGKEKTKAAYFDEVIAPHVRASGADVQAERQKFMDKDLPWYELVIRHAADYWPYALTGSVVLIAVIFRRRVAIAGEYAVNNAFRIAALAGALALAVLAMRALQGPLFVFFR